MLEMKWPHSWPPSRKVREVCLYRDIAGRIARIQVRSPAKAQEAESVKCGAWLRAQAANRSF